MSSNLTGFRQHGSIGSSPLPLTTPNITHSPPANHIMFEKAWLNAPVLNAAIYGVNVSLYLVCFRALLRKTTRSNYKKQLPFLVFIALSFVLNSIYTFSTTNFANLAFIDNNNPEGYYFHKFDQGPNEPSNVAFVLLNWTADSFVLWRYMIISRACKLHIGLAMILPCLLFIASMALGVLFLIQWSNSSPWGMFLGIDFTPIFLGISLGLNILFTILIVLRLLYFRSRAMTAFGAHHGAQYTSAAGIIVESAAIYSTFSFVFLVLFAVHSGIAPVFLGSLGSIQIFSSLLIIWRISQGNAWSLDDAPGIMNADPILMMSRPNPLRPFLGQSQHKTVRLSSATEQGIKVTTEIFKDCEAHYGIDREAHLDSDSESERPSQGRFIETGLGAVNALTECGIAAIGVV
ncbi:hypothetical protein BJ138DRAFT_1013346 [Hygrophoropsis aurantiaca]|uniref:Uncharacterized protein n=1 Tax=Hygrophoropsis aurantiaca TaxID=72124 RepID=A0ACB8A415_9AGAM|nr:hypothetical protein BJ138DRAFT_1013346 [Hygrophoropsis aurantiaca]